MDVQEGNEQLKIKRKEAKLKRKKEEEQTNQLAMTTNEGRPAPASKIMQAKKIIGQEGENENGIGSGETNIDEGASNIEEREVVEPVKSNATFQNDIDKLFQNTLATAKSNGVGTDVSPDAELELALRSIANETDGTVILSDRIILRI